MLDDIKTMLLEDPKAIVSLLEAYDYCHIVLKPSEIRFARNEDGGLNIRIRLEDNDKLLVKDFVKNETNDIVGYIMKCRCVPFSDVLSKIKKILGLSDYWAPKEKKPLFGGFYENIGKNVPKQPVEYPESVLDAYDRCGNKAWVKDGISLSTQRKFDVCYDIYNDYIIFPWRSAISGAIIALKARTNYIPEPGFPKYFYVLKGAVSNSLYGYSENYAYLNRCDRLFVFESEKSVQILSDLGINTAVALGSNNLSDAQARIIASVSPKEVWFMLDKDLPLENTFKNIGVLKEYMRMMDCTIRYWDWTQNTTVCEKGAPVDMGFEIFDDICSKEMKVSQNEQ